MQNISNMIKKFFQLPLQVIPACPGSPESFRPLWAVMIAVSLVSMFLFPVIVLAQDYLIGEGDLLKITVYDNPDLTSEPRVGGDGRITFPLIGEVTVTGLSSAEVQKKIAGLLSNGFIKKPQVSVFITEYKSKKVTTLGEFTKPGLIELRGNATLMEVISNAGGITANGAETLVIQRKILKPEGGRGDDVTLTVDLVKLLEKGDIAANIMVLDGDSIYVPRAAFVYVTGEVKTPGAYKITKGLTVLRSITLAGGFTQKAWKGRTNIIRKSEKGESEISAKMEDLVMPDDVIVVPESFF
ncbi:MAG: periplasmic polysaccharide biosynthesis/export protein [Thermodesulfovibrio sp.]|nr:periplasmic polysaccharide biosynthesis/export protein [Thermodesulfovibrio sp.]